MGASLALAPCIADAQQAQLSAAPASESQSTLSVPANAPAISTISLDEAITRAKANEPTFAAAVAAAKVASVDRSLARKSLLPGVVYHNQYLYTEPHHAPGQDSNAPPRFIAGNSVHEYISQGSANETIGLAGITAAAHATAAAAIAHADLEVARRGLVSAVVNLYYSSLSADQKVAIAQRAFNESNDFTTLTQHRENAREVAHADVIKAQLTSQQRQRDLSDSTLAAEKARLDLGVLLFSDPRTPYSLMPTSAPPPLPARTEAEAAASRNNPDLQSALATLQASALDVTAARAGYLPDLNLNFSYGIDAQQFAVHAPDGSRNLGYSASATLDIPVWDWLSTRDRIKQKTILRDSARVALTNTQRKLVAELDEFYNEAAVARSQLDSLDLSAQTARESLRLTRLRYVAGEASVLDVVDAQSSLVGAEQAREDGIVRYQNALAQLQILTGTF